MQHGMANAIDLLEVERKLVDRELKYHSLIAELCAQEPRPSRFEQVLTQLRSIFPPRKPIVEQRGI